MKKMSCEACGSNELTKKGDYFVCDYCQTSYQLPKSFEDKAATTIYNKTTIINQAAEAPPIFNQKVKKTSFFKRLLAIPMMLIGALFLLVAYASVRTFDVFGIILFGWWSVSLLNLSYTMSTGNKALLTKKFNGWQLALITLLVFIFLITLV